MAPPRLSTTKFAKEMRFGSKTRYDKMELHTLSYGGAGFGNDTGFVEQGVHCHWMPTAAGSKDAATTYRDHFPKPPFYRISPLRHVNTNC